MKFKIALLGLSAVVVFPALAAMGDRGADRGAARGPVTRADVEARIAARFSALDTNRDGAVEQSEATAARAKMREDRRDARFKAMDKNGNGEVTRAEFDAQLDQPAAARGDKRGRMRGMEMRKGRGGASGAGLFGVADANSDGKVTLSEALARPLARFDQADANKDGTLSAEERLTARQARRGKRI